MWTKGDTISGRYNYPMDGRYYTCTVVQSKDTKEFIKLIDVIEYKIKLFEDNTNADIYDMIEVMEALNSSGTSQFRDHEFFRIAKDYDMILLNQKLIDVLFINDTSRYAMKYMEGIQLKDKLIPIYLLPKDNVCMYLLKLDSENRITSYRKLKRGD